MKNLKFLVVLALVALFAAPAIAADTIKIGFNIPLTGDIPEVGEGSKNAAEMYKADINGAGGLEVGGKKYMLEFIYMDNEAKADSAVNAALKLIEQEEVVAIIGPNSSKQAVPAGGTANENRVPMISPWSTNPNTTLDRPWVFRAAFLDPFQGPVIADFAAKNLVPRPQLCSSTSPTTILSVWQKYLKLPGKPKGSDRSSPTSRMAPKIRISPPS